jgi:DHA1 family inner membrane transport protein
MGMGVVLLLFSVFAPTGWWTLPLGFLITTLGSVLVVNLQLRLMQVAGDAQTLGAALNHASLNIANAAGALLGGAVIAAGYGYRSTGAVGAGLAALGFVVLVLSAAMERRARSGIPRKDQSRHPV